MMWLYPVAWLAAGVFLISIGERPDAFGAVVASAISGMACFAKEFD